MTDREALEADFAVFDAAFEAWRLKHPGGRFSEFSAARIASALKKGRPHTSLGPNLTKPGGWWNAGAGLFREGLAQHTPAPTDRICDYGCGSLRIGAHFIKRQAPDTFWGLDVTDDFLAYGPDLIGPELMAEKRPRLGTIDALLDQAIAADIDLVLSTVTAMQVHPDEKDEYLSNLKRLAHRPGAHVQVMVVLGDEAIRYRRTAWAWPLSFYEAAMQPMRLVSNVHRVDQAEGDLTLGNHYLLFRRD